MNSTIFPRFPATALVVSVVFLWSVGLLSLHSVEMEIETPLTFRKQWIFGGVGFLLMGLAALFDYRRLRWRSLCYAFLVLSLILLVLVLLQPASAKINGARRWLWGLGQPSELAKLGLILALAHYYALHHPFVEDFHTGFKKPGLVIFILAFLIAVEPDWGTAVLLIAAGSVMMFAAGVRWQYLLLAAGGAMLVLAIGIGFNDIRRERWLAFIHPEEYRRTLAWQTWNTMLAMALGGLGGRGPGQGRFKAGYVPEQSTDFILSVIGEEWGLLGTLLVLGAFVAILVSGFMIASRAADRFGRLLALGVTSLISLQALIHFGVATSLLPNKGISLPFVSYGGSNLLVMMTGIGLLLSVARVGASTEANGSVADRAGEPAGSDGPDSRPIDGGVPCP